MRALGIADGDMGADDGGIHSVPAIIESTS